MAEIKAWPLNLATYEYNAGDVQRWMAGRTSGVYGQDGNYEVVAKERMTVTVKSEGMAGGWLSCLGRQGVCFWNSEDIDLVVPLSHSQLNRVDRVIVSWYCPQQSELPKVIIRSGTPAENPEPPDLVNDEEYAEICLADINVPAGATVITGENIVDRRLDESLCGIVTTGIEKYPTTGFEREFSDWLNNVKLSYNEWLVLQKEGHDSWFYEAQRRAQGLLLDKDRDFDELYGQIQDTLDDDTAGNLLNLINGNRESINRLEEAVLNPVTSNPFSVDFTTLDAVTVTGGYWNSSQRRIEC